MSLVEVNMSLFLSVYATFFVFSKTLFYLNENEEWTTSLLRLAHVLDRLDDVLRLVHVVRQVR